jgi:hypothetical protein
MKINCLVGTPTSPRALQAMIDIWYPTQNWKVEKVRIKSRDDHDEVTITIRQERDSSSAAT